MSDNEHAPGGLIFAIIVAVMVLGVIPLGVILVVRP